MEMIHAYQLKEIIRSSRCGTVKTNPTSIHGDAGPIPSLTQWVGDPALSPTGKTPFSSGYF